MSKKIFVIISVILTAALCCQVSSLTANAETVAEIVTPATSTSKSINTSQISTTILLVHQQKRLIAYAPIRLNTANVSLRKKGTTTAIHVDINVLSPLAKLL